MPKPFVVPVVLSLSASAGLAGSLLYWLWKRQQSPKRNCIDMLKKRLVTLEIIVPAYAVPLLIGKRGEVIQAIEEQTDTKIIFKGSGPNRRCVIYGLKEDVPLAQMLITESVKDLPLIQSIDLWLPEAVCAKISERNTLKSLTWNSRARIIIDKEKLTQPTGSPKKVILQGTPQQLSVVQALLQDKVSDLEAQDRLRSTSNDYLKSPPSRSARVVNEQSNVEPLVATNSDGFAETYVCSVVNPYKFYVQLVGPHAILLDRLVQDMTEFYEQDENKELYALPINAQNNDIIAAKFSHDGSWYRARIQSINGDLNSASQIVLFFVDFGDMERCADLTHVCKLAPQFETLKYQAIECCLANVQSKNGDWSEQAIARFEELVYNAQWKIIMAKVNGYNENEIPLVDLVDTSGSQDEHVAAALVGEGFAQWTGT